MLAQLAEQEPLKLKVPGANPGHLTMRINDMDEKDIHVGMRIRSLIDRSHLGTIVKIDHDDDEYAWIHWDGEEYPYSGFCWNQCECEVVEGT